MNFNCLSFQNGGGELVLETHSKANGVTQDAEIY